MTRTSKIDTSAFTVSPDAQRTRLHSPPQRPVETRPVDALLDALREALDLSFMPMTPEVVEKLRRRIGTATMEAKSMKSQLQRLEGR